MVSREPSRVKSPAEWKKDRAALAKVVEDVFPGLLESAKKNFVKGKKFGASTTLSYKDSKRFESRDEEVFVISCMEQRFDKAGESVTVSISMPDTTLLGIKFRAMIHVSRK